MTDITLDSLTPLSALSNTTELLVSVGFPATFARLDPSAIITAATSAATSAVGSLLTTESTTRAQADANLNTALNTEIDIRNTAITRLTANLATLTNTVAAISTTGNSVNTSNSIGVVAPSSNNIVSIVELNRYMPLYDGTGSPHYILPADFINSLGAQPSDTSVPQANAISSTDKWFIDQGLGVSKSVSMSQLLAFISANLTVSNGTSSPIIILSQPSSTLAGNPYTLTGSLGNYSTAPTLQLSFDGGAFGALPAGSSDTSTGVNLAMPATTAGTHTVQLKDQNGVLSNILTFTATTEALTLNTISSQIVGVPFTVSGTYVNVTPTALDYSLDSGTNWIAVGSATIGSGNFSFSLTINVANGTQTVKVRDRNATGVFVTSSSFAVVATTITVTTPANNWVQNTTRTLAGTYTGTIPIGVAYVVDSATNYVSLASFVASGGTWSGSLTVPAAGTHTITVQETNNTNVTATSASFTSLTVAPPLQSSMVLTASPNFTSNGAKFGATAFSQGQASATIAMPDSVYTIEFFIKNTDPTNTASIGFFMSDNNYNGSGFVNDGVWQWFNASHNYFVSGILQDGNVHHYAIVPTDTALGSCPAAVYVDGVRISDTYITAGARTTTFNLFGVGSNAVDGFGTVNGGGHAIFSNFAIFNGRRYTANFTPPTALYTRTAEPSLIAYWPLISDGSSL